MRYEIWAMRISDMRKWDIRYEIGYMRYESMIYEIWNIRYEIKYIRYYNIRYEILHMRYENKIFS